MAEEQLIRQQRIDQLRALIEHAVCEVLCLAIEKRPTGPARRAIQHYVNDLAALALTGTAGVEGRSNG